MANWNDLRKYIKSNYKVADDGLDTMKLIFNVGGGRTQLVMVTKAGELEGSEWAVISTAVCDEGQIDPRSALVRNSKMLVGGLALVEGGPGVFRHSFPLADLDPLEFEQPLHVAALFGDELERELSGGDRY